MRSTKCPFHEMSLHEVGHTKCPFHEVSFHEVSITKCPFHEVGTTKWTSRSGLPRSGLDPIKQHKYKKLPECSAQKMQ